MAANGILEFQGTEKAIFRGSNSNIVIDTANSSFGVGVDTPTSNLHIVGKTSLQGDLNLVQVSNVANVTVNSNVVAEYTGPHDRPLRKYPEVAMMSGQSGLSGGYTQDGYTVEASSELDTLHLVSNAFNYIQSYQPGDYAWISGGDTYGLTDGLANSGTSKDMFQGVNGSWLGITLPVAIRLDHVHIYNRHDGANSVRPPKTGIIWASNDGTSWYNIFSFDNLSNTDGVLNVLHVNNTNFYTRYRVQITAMHNDPQKTSVAVGELELYGYEEGSGSLDTTLKSVYNVPATTGTQLEVYYDGRETSSYPGSGATVYDISPNTNHGTLGTGVGFDATYKAFTFNGNTNQTSNISTTVTTTGSGWSHSAACWFKLDEQASSLTDIYSINPQSTSTFSSNAAVASLHLSRLYLVTGSNDVYFDFLPQVNVWYHICHTYSGGGTENIKWYLNGIEQVLKQGTYTNAVINFETTNNVLLGSQMASHTGMDGSIANFRLYSKALNADQVKELYDYQKDYFLGSKSQVTLYKGHLGVGVTEPSGQLELAGDERIQEYPPRGMTNPSTYIEGHGVFKAYGSQPASAHPAWYAFDHTGNLSSVWYSDNLSEFTGTGEYNGSTRLAPETPKGPYVVLEMPYEIVLKQIKFWQQFNGSHVWDRGVYYAKCNPSDEWTAIHNVTDRPADDDTPYVAYITDTRPYKYFAIVITRRHSASSTAGVSIRDLQFFGTPGPTTLDKGSLSLTRSLDVPRVSRYDVDTETPRPEKLVLDFDTTVNSSPTDISGRGNHGTFKGTAQYSPVEKAFSFDGNSDYIQGTLNLNGSELDGSYTLSAWVKRSSTTNTQAHFFYIGVNGAGDSIGFRHNSSTSYRLYHYDQGTAEATSQPGNLNEWRHYVATYDGTNRQMYIDGVLVDVTNPVPTGSLGIPNNPTFSLGMRYANLSNGSEYLHGYMSNPKIYSVALEPSEVRKLYKLGRTGRSMVISDTAVGIGKVPEAQLDVRGNISCDGILKPYTCAFSAWAYNTGGNSSTTDIFPAENVHFNIGNCYNTSTYKFTAPIKGIYHMSWSAFTNQAPDTPSRIFGYLNNSIHEQKGDSIERHGNSLSLTLVMEPGDQFYFRGSTTRPLYYYAANAHNRFSGHLICAL